MAALSPHKFFHDEKERRRWQNPEAILSVIGLRLGFTFVDVGCNDGFFTLPAARLVGSKGKVYGIDVDDEAISRLNEKASKEGLRNLHLIVGEAEDTIVCESCAEIVFFGIVLHDFKDPASVLVNAKKMVKPTGRLIDLDWKKEPMNLGPPLRTRFSERQAVELIKDAGFRIETVKNSGLYHYMIIAKS